MVTIQEWFLIKSCLWWRAYDTWFFDDLLLPVTILRLQTTLLLYGLKNHSTQGFSVIVSLIKKIQMHTDSNQTLTLEVSEHRYSAWKASRIVKKCTEKPTNPLKNCRLCNVQPKALDRLLGWIYSKASRYTASRSTDLGDTRFLIGSQNT